MDQEAMMLIAAGTILVFVWIACALMPHKTSWKEGWLCDCDRSLEDQYAVEQTPKYTPVYVMLCISTENTLRAVLPGPKALLAEIPVYDYQRAEAHANFATQIVDGLSNVYGLGVEPIIYTTPLAHNILPAINGQHAAMLVHNHVVARLANRRAGLPDRALE